VGDLRLRLAARRLLAEVDLVLEVPEDLDPGGVAQGHREGGRLLLSSVR
jgi:hypothetical protein